ncbi:LytR/AlgR family response regulator transcription factor [Gracilimonas sediminicola]|uniref:LytTR family DNA-binding domain-containing protein n=1 Tax=Gracilimonas sediminicola TaxID=2952158 RepID=A0A9X2L2S8_9BACT|nr:LytTR family DNA-binding domain-containing protein [Gracilimonas sediminicola]MCP9291200.1 LytTR family DNA-binding domain-containing protein [Gracilimonas sediminicola]
MMRCVIIDDEPAARSVLEQYIADTPELQLTESCKNALEARKVVKEKDVDLLFLDVNMPRLSGIEFLKTLNNAPRVILTTAYSEYALEGYELDVVDYLLKPFSFERFLKAVDKAWDKTEASQAADQVITIKADGKLYRVGVNDIMFAESQGDYITVHTKEKKLTFNQTLKDFYSQLPESLFSRVHKSYVVALAKIDYLEGNLIKLGNHSLPVGKAYKEAFLEKYTA